MTHIAQKYSRKTWKRTRGCDITQENVEVVISQLTLKYDY